MGLQEKELARIVAMGFEHAFLAAVRVAGHEAVRGNVILTA